MTVIKLTLLVHLAATLYMVGLVWFVQVVHYPLMSRVGTADFAAYEKAHLRLMNWVVAPVMLLEVVTGGLLLGFRPEELSPILLWTGFVLLGVIILSTMLLQMPKHKVLEGGFVQEAHRWLVVSNWIRTICWSVRGLLVLILAAGVMKC